MKLCLPEVHIPSECLPCDDWHHVYWTVVSLWAHRDLSIARCGTCGATWSWVTGTCLGLMAPGPVVQFNVRRAA